MVTIFLYTVFLFLFLSFLLSKSVCLGIFLLYARYLLHFIYEKEDEDLLKIATNRLQKGNLKKVIFLTSNAIPIMTWKKTQFPFENNKKNNKISSESVTIQDQLKIHITLDYHQTQTYQVHHNHNLLSTFNSNTIQRRITFIT